MVYVLAEKKDILREIPLCESGLRAGRLAENPASGRQVRPAPGRRRWLTSYFHKTITLNRQARGPKSGAGGEVRKSFAE
jgi:hypothetical protein